jgi:hypothetical protein
MPDFLGNLFVELLSEFQALQEQQLLSTTPDQSSTQLRFVSCCVLCI